jgi:hypothetical protein
VKKLQKERSMIGKRLNPFFDDQKLETFEIRKKFNQFKEFFSSNSTTRRIK